MICNHISELVGNTPLLLIPETVHGIKGVKLYAKLEYMNPFGSLKDRIAKQMLELALTEINQQKKTVVESSSGNTAKALAALCGAYGAPFITITNRIKVPEVRMILQVLGSHIQEMPGTSECPDLNDPKDPVVIARELEKGFPHKYHHTDQYFNKANIEAHRKSGSEIHNDLGDVDCFFGYLGTCGSTVGIGSYLREKQKKKPEVVGIITAEGQFVPGGRNEAELHETGFFEKSFYDEIVKGTTQEAIDGMLKLNRSVGMLCGPTTGLTYSATVKALQKKINGRTEITAVFIACDRLEPYMSYLRKYRPGIFDTSVKTEELSEEEIAYAQQISPHDLLEEKEAVIIDLRSNYSYHLAHIPNSINILDQFFEELMANGSFLPKEQKVVLVCPVGRISRRFSAHYKKRGYSNVYSLEGGFEVWKQKGGPIATNTR